MDNGKVVAWRVDSPVSCGWVNGCPEPVNYEMAKSVDATIELAYSAAAVMELVEAGNRVTKAFRALGEVEFPREKYNARFECEQSMIALDAALAPYREKADAAE